jgi:hypothetical protein
MCVAMKLLEWKRLQRCIYDPEESIANNCFLTVLGINFYNVPDFFGTLIGNY